MNEIVFALALTWCLVQTGIVEIEVRGNQLVPETSVLYYAGLQGSPSRTEIERAFQRLWDTGLFEDVRFDSEPSTEGLTLVITVDEKPILRNTRFVGEPIDEARIGEGLRRAGFPLHSPRPMGDSDRREIERAVGRLLGGDRDVTATLEPASDVQVDLVLEVKRRDRPRIETIAFRGNRSIEDGDLLGVMRSRSSSFLSRLTHRDRYRRETLESDLEAVGDLYRSRGYARASVGEPDVRFDGTGRVHIEIPVVEGERYRFGAVEVEPGSLLSREDARSFLPSSGSGYDSREIDAAVERLTNHYLALGYPEVRVEREETSVPETGLTNVTLRVVEGRFLRVGRITFHGHVRHRDRDLRQFLDLDELDRFDPRKLDSSVRALSSTGDFLAVTPSIDLEVGPVRGDLDLQVEEKPVFEYLAGGGLSGIEGGAGSGQILARGLLGRGETLSTDLDLGSRFRNVAFGYRDLSTLGRRLFLAAGFRRTNLDFPDETGEDTVDVALRAGGPFGAKWQFLGSFRFSGFTLDSSLEEDVPFLTPFLGKRFHTYRAGVVVLHETRDRPVFASRGRRLAAGYELVAGDVELHRLRVDATTLAPLDRRGRHVVGLSGRAEALWSYGRSVESGVPRFERLFLGSENDMRAFPIRGVGPRSGANVVGGDRLVYASAEYRFSPASRLGLVGFFDAGNVFASDFEDDPAPELRYDAGAEVQVLLPFANLPLRIGYGFNLDPLPDEPRRRFFVSLAVRF